MERQEEEKAHGRDADYVKRGNHNSKCYADCLGSNVADWTQEKKDECDRKCTSRSK